MKLAFAVIPQDPTGTEYWLGSTLGDEHKHWQRAKFFQQYGLFLCFHAASKLQECPVLSDDALRCGIGAGDRTERG